MNDPVKGCDVYKDIGCAHVDGFLCDYPNCSLLKDYKMNNRIKQIAEQAGSVYQKNLDVYLLLPDELEKLVELIVKECIDSVLDSSVEYATRPQIAEELKEHFGVGMSTEDKKTIIKELLGVKNETNQ